MCWKSQGLEQQFILKPDELLGTRFGPGHGFWGVEGALLGICMLATHSLVLERLWWTLIVYMFMEDGIAEIQPGWKANMLNTQLCYNTC